MAIRNRSLYQSTVDSLIDNTGSGGTSGTDLESAFNDLSDSVAHVGSRQTLVGASWDMDSYDARTANRTVTTSETITLTNPLDNGIYRLLITKSTNDDVEIDFTAAGYTVVYPNLEDYIVLAGVTGSRYMITIHRLGSYLICQIQYENNVSGQVRIAVSSAELLTLNSSPKLMIAAPGSGFAIEIIDVVRHYEYGTTTYAGAGASAVQLNYGNSSSLAAAAAFVITQTQDYVQKISSSLQRNKTDIDNAAIYLYSTADPTTGDGTDEYVIEYKIIRLR